MATAVQRGLGGGELVRIERAVLVSVVGGQAAAQQRHVGGDLRAGEAPVVVLVQALERGAAVAAVARSGLLRRCGTRGGQGDEGECQRAAPKGQETPCLHESSP